MSQPTNFKMDLLLLVKYCAVVLFISKLRVQFSLQYKNAGIKLVTMSKNDKP